MRTGTIKGFSGSWGSGIATMLIKDDGAKKAHAVHCENAPTVRALASMFPGTIGDGHTVNSGAILGQRVRYETDDMGMLSELAPAGLLKKCPECGAEEGSEQWRTVCAFKPGRKYWTTVSMIGGRR